MSLVSVHDGDIHDFLTDVTGLSDNPGPVWIGLTKSRTGQCVTYIPPYLIGPLIIFTYRISYIQLFNYCHGLKSCRRWLPKALDIGQISAHRRQR